MTSLIATPPFPDSPASRSSFVPPAPPRLCPDYRGTKRSPAARPRIEREPDVAEIRVSHMLQFRQLPRRQDPNHRALSHKTCDTAPRFHPPCAGIVSHTYSVERMPRSTGSKCVVNTKSFAPGPRCSANLRRVAVREQVIRAKILVHFDEMSFALGLFARAAYARFAIADNSARRIDPARFDQAAAGPRITDVG